MNQFFQNLKLSNFAAVIVSIPVFFFFFLVIASEKAREYKKKFEEKEQGKLANT